jgi:hypothetical protein
MNEVMSQFGSCNVDFKSEFANLKPVDFHTPIVVECVKVSATADGALTDAGANRKFVELALGSI